MYRRSSRSKVSKRTNVSVRGNLIDAKRKKWREDNRESLAAYNEHVEKHGTFSDDFRRA